MLWHENIDVASYVARCNAGCYKYIRFNCKNLRSTTFTNDIFLSIVEILYESADLALCLSL